MNVRFILTTAAILAAIIFSVNGCGGGGGGDNGGGVKTSAFLEQDSDNDGVADFLDAYPTDSSRAAIPITVESEFNNNIIEADNVDNSETIPFAINAKLEKGSNYYLDSDYFKFSAQKGQSLSILVFPGEVKTTPMVHMQSAGTCVLKANILNSLGQNISGKTFSLFSNMVNGLGIEIV
jgi:hypothetical protein